MLVIGAGVFGVLVTRSQPRTPEVSVVLPLDHTLVTGRQTLQVYVAEAERQAHNYRVSWQVDGGVRGGVMGNTESGFVDVVDIDDWNWRKDNTYTIRFQVEQAGVVVATAERVVYTIDTAIFAERYQEQERERLAQAQEQQRLRDQAERLVAPGALDRPTVAGASTVQNLQAEMIWLTQDRRDSVTQDVVVALPDELREPLVVFWSAEGGHQNEVTKRTSDGDPVVSINFSGWWWKGNGPYPLTISIQSLEGAVLATERFEFMRDPANQVLLVGLDARVALGDVTPSSSSTSEKPRALTPLATVGSSPTLSEGEVLASLSPWRLTRLTTGDKPAIEADLRAAQNSGQQEAVSALGYILSQPQSTWLNGNNYDWELMSSAFALARQEQSTPVFVLYNIPQRDCGLYSRGGATDYVRYREWIDRVAAATVWDAVFVVEPDALAMLNCLSNEGQQARLDAIAYAVTTLSALSNVYVYVDAGHAFWVAPTEMADRLQRVNVAAARGFALNTSNYITTSDSRRYGDRLAGLLGGKGYVIDSSRNGQGQHPAYQWCNPAGRGLGRVPTVHFSGYFDAELWIKTPGESDGYCNGGPNAGTWWRDYAVGLYQNRVR